MSLKRKAAELAAVEAKKPKANGSITAFFAAPKAAAAATKAETKTETTKDEDGNTMTTTVTTAASTSLPALPKFDKAKWVEKLTAEQKDLLQLEIDTLDDSWLAHLKDEITGKSFLNLKRFLKEEHNKKQAIFPPAQDVYSWSRHTPFDKVKVVVIGQDPYHNVNQAHGMCFSVRPPTPAPPSLLNMYKSIEMDYPEFQRPPNKGGLLTPWADQGVLLLNSCLTVRAHQANSHKDRGWEKFTQKVIDLVADKKRGGVVFIAWGAYAKKRVASAGKGGRHHILEGVHPSPLSADKGPVRFVDQHHFKKTNEWLKQRYGEGGQIDWNLNVAPEEAAVY